VSRFIYDPSSIEGVNLRNNLGPLAQSVEQRTFNPWVVGSIPTGPTGISLYRELGRLSAILGFASKLGGKEDNIYPLLVSY
jgi:hypothetical protein